MPAMRTAGGTSEYEQPADRGRMVGFTAAVRSVEPPGAYGDICVVRNPADPPRHRQRDGGDGGVRPVFGGGGGWSRSDRQAPRLPDGPRDPPGSRPAVRLRPLPGDRRTHP